MKIALSAMATLGLLLVLPAPVATAATGTSCAPIQKKVTKAVKAGKKAKAKRLRQQLRTCKQAANVRSQIAGFTFTGTRGDGQAVAVTLCANGRWESRTGSRPVGISTGTSWFVRPVGAARATNWTVEVAESADPRGGGWSIGMARRGDAFQIGIASLGRVSDLGPVTRAPGDAVCATLG
jgi:hypothetical protein